MQQSLGSIVDGLGCVADVPDEALASGAVVITRMVATNGRVTVTLAVSEGMAVSDAVTLPAIPPGKSKEVRRGLAARPSFFRGG